MLIKPATYDGTTSWLDYRSHFEACASLGNWSEDDKALYLAVSLRGQAQSVLGDLAGGVPKRYDELVTTLNERFSPPNQMELYRAQLRERKQRASDSLPELGQSIRRLTNLAYPTAPLDVRETLAKEYFIDALIDSDIRLRIKQARPAALNDAIRQAVELEAFLKVEQKNKELKDYVRPVEVSEPKVPPQGDSELGKLVSRLDNMQKAMLNMEKEIKELKLLKPAQAYAQKETKGDNQKIICYNCGRSGHFGRDCHFKKQPRGGGRGRGRGFQRGNQRPYNNQQGRQNAIKRSSNNSGMFVNVQICDKNVKLLVDTGATLSILSDNLYNSLKSSLGGEHKLTKVKREILSATDEPVKCSGKTVMSIKIGNKIYKQEFAIAEISTDGVIGLDFLNKYRCKVDIVNRKLLIDSDEVPMISQGSIGCYRISVSETCSIPLRSEMTVYENVNISEKDYLSAGVSLIEPEESFTKTDRGLVAKTLVENNKSVPLRIMNVSSDVKTIHSGTFVASLSPIDKVMGSDEQYSHTQGETLSPALNDLLKTMSQRVTGKQRNEVKKLLSKHKLYLPAMTRN